MSTQPRAEFVAEELSERAVHDYLLAHLIFLKLLKFVDAME